MLERRMSLHHGLIDFRDSHFVDMLFSSMVPGASPSELEICLRAKLLRD